MYIKGGLKEIPMVYDHWVIFINKTAHTVVLKKESKWHDLWSKWPIYDLVLYNVIPCSGPLGSTLPLTGALKWGTAWTSSSTGTGIMKGQSWTFVFYKVNFKALTLTFHKSCTRWGRSS